jgi:transcription elongation GreA/GreB family factor
LSRAFVKEDAAAPPPPALERPVSTAPNLVTPRRARLIGQEIARLEAEIAAMADEAAAELLRRDLRYWTTRRATAQPVAPEAPPDAAGFGTRVTIRREGKVFAMTIVGEDEADPETGRIAWTSPLARALHGAEAGETVELAAGGRTVPIEVLAVAPGEA